MTHTDGPGEAARWLALIGAGELSEEQRAAFGDWCRAYPEQWRRIEVLQAHLGGLRVADFSALPSAPLIRAMDGTTSRRRLLRSGAGLLGVGALACTAGYLLEGPAWHPGVLSTGTAQRLQLRLDDGSRLTLNARTRVRLQGHRALALDQGEVCLEVIPGEPFTLETPCGRMSTAQARLLLRHHAAASTLSVLTGQVTFDEAAQVLEAGTRVRFDGQGIHRLPANSQGEDAWLGGWLRAEDRPLAEIVERLRDYRSGFIHLGRGASSLRASGLYPLDDTDLSLRLLADSLGLALRYRSRFWVSLDSVLG